MLIAKAAAFRDSLDVETQLAASPGAARRSKLEKSVISRRSSVVTEIALKTDDR
jgi:hypothetical protein